MYKTSRYNHWGSVGDNSYLVYNLLTSSVALLSEVEFREIISLQFSNEDIFNMALKEGFIVPSEEDEVEKVLLLQRMNNYSSRFAGFQILPTTNCNANCWYCYEHDFLKKRMTADIADRIPEFISSYFSMVDDIHITWFGGEPLLELETMASISSKLVELCEKEKIGYSSDIITNASLINPSVIKELVGTCRISQAQITLDGMGERHTFRKGYKDKTISFQSILNAMQLLIANEVRLLIRINIDRANVQDCLELISFLGDKWASNPEVTLYVAPLYGVKESTSFFKQSELNSLYQKIFESMVDSGWIQTLDGLPMNFNNATCSARMINNFVITPEGEVFKCEHLLSKENEKVGTVFGGIVFNQAMTTWTSPDLPEKCRECSYLPSCQGGCLAAEELNFGFERCPHIAFIGDAIINSAAYLLQNKK